MATSTMMKKLSLATASAALVAFGAGGAAQASSVIIGGPGLPNAGDCAPFSCVQRYQQVYDASLFSTPILIDTISFFNKNYDPGNIAAANYTIKLSTTGKAVNGLSNNFADNLGANNKTFFEGFLSGPITDGKFSITGNSFLYDPSQGNLLLDVFKDGGIFDFSTYLDYTPYSNGSFSRLYSFDNGPSGDTNNNYGLVTEFSGNSNPEPVPEPASALGLLALGAMGAGSLKRKQQKNVTKKA